MKRGNILTSWLALFLVAVVTMAAQEAPKTPPGQDQQQDQQKSEQGKTGTGDKPQAEKKKQVPVSVRRKPISPTVDSTANAQTIAAAAERLSKIPGDFNLAPIPGSPILYNLTLWETSQRVSVTLMVNISQVRVYTSIMDEARKFAAGVEGVGKTKPITTRFYDNNDPSFFVDIAKMGNRSQFFVTVKSREASVTVDAGTLKRGEDTQEMFFDTMLTRLHETVDKPPAQNQ